MRLPTSLGSILSLAVAACATPPVAPPAPPPAPASPDPNAPLWDYDVTADAALDLDVRATFRGPIGGGGLTVDDAAAAFVDRLEIEDGATWRKQGIDDPKWEKACAVRCTLRYHVRLKDLANKAADLDVAISAGGAIVSPSSTWLMRPSAMATGRYRFSVKTPPGVKFATGIRAAPNAKSPSVYEAATTTFDESAFAAFGALRLGHVADPAIEHAIAPGVGIPDEALAKWLRAEVSAIGSYFGHPPNGTAMLFVTPSTTEVTGGKTLGGGGASVVVRLGMHLGAKEIMDDWVLAHELVHVAFPDLDRKYTWFSEGLATYVEPVARARAGLVKREKVWGEIVDGLPQGVAKPADGGLDGSTEWGRVYWGGAFYFLLADVRIRERTKNAKGLDDGLRAVVAAGGNVETPWPLERVLEVADGATGTTVMRDTYKELGPTRANVDVHALLRKLGVRVEGGMVRFDDAAPLAAVRDAIIPVRAK